jgi:hypothetical protein
MSHEFWLTASSAASERNVVVNLQARVTSECKTLSEFDHRKFMFIPVWLTDFSINKLIDWPTLEVTCFRHSVTCGGAGSPVLRMKILEVTYPSTRVQFVILVFSPLSLLKKIKFGLWYDLAVCVSLLYQIWMSGPVFMKLGMHTLAPQPISMTYFINPSHQSVCLYVYPPIIARQRHSKHVPAATNTRNDRRIVGLVILYNARALSKESLWVSVCIHNFSKCTTEAVICSLPGPTDSKIWPWVPWNGKQRITVQARTNSNLLDWPAYHPVVARQRLGKQLPTATNCYRRRFIYGHAVSKKRRFLMIMLCRNMTTRILCVSACVRIESRWGRWLYAPDDNTW